MSIEEFVCNFSLQDIINIEKNEDLQYVVLAKCWRSINQQKYRDDFLFAIVVNALISYQLSWTWETWWSEFAEYTLSNIWDVKSIDFWRWLLQNTKSNRRLNTIKIKRIEKILDKKVNIILDLPKYKQNLLYFNQAISKIMSQSDGAKTVVFATKMFGYWLRIVTDKSIIYPYEIFLPVDSRITKIFELETWKLKHTSSEIQQYFQKMSIDYSIPSLHLDSLLWIRYWKMI